MRSNVCVIKKGGIGLETILSEVEKVARYEELGKKETLRLRLLAEELTGMLPELVKEFEGRFFATSKGKRFELHVEVSAEDMTREKKDSLIAVSKSKKNASARGIMGKIREAAENMLLYVDSPEAAENMMNYQPMLSSGADYSYSYSWSLDQYRELAKKSDAAEAWDELERSIVAKLADDVLVGIKGKKVEIVIIKTFN